MGLLRSLLALPIAPSERRIASMMTKERKITGDRLAALFLYATPERLNAAGAFGPAWLSTDTENISLLEG